MTPEQRPDPYCMICLGRGNRPHLDEHSGEVVPRECSCVKRHNLWGIVLMNFAIIIAALAIIKFIFE